MSGAILIVEDEADVRDLLAANLEHAGYRVSVAGDVAKAEVMMREVRPDLVLLDWVLPGIPGLSFARKLRGKGFDLSGDGKIQRKCQRRALEAARHFLEHGATPAE